jgi:hypothetical protein
LLGSVPFPAPAVSVWVGEDSPLIQQSPKEIMMTASSSPALDVALAYHQAWTNHDLDEAMTYVADEIVCDAPAGRLVGAAYREFMGPFVRILTGSKLIAAFGDQGWRSSCMTPRRCRSRAHLALNA